jgi:hypothetical protein
MSQQEQIQAEDDEISLVDILLFLKASGGNIVKSTFVCLFAGGIYYFSIPKVYEAFAAFEMATVAGEPVETPAALLEKMKLPIYFSSATLQACGTDDEPNSRAKFVGKLKPNINKSGTMVLLVTEATSSQEAKACLNAAIADVSSNQDAIANPLIEMKKQKLNQLSELLKTAEEMGKSSSFIRIDRNLSDTQLTINYFVEILRRLNVSEINDLRSQISSLKFDLIEPKTRPTTSLNSVYSTDVSVNKRPLFTLGLCLALGVFLGLLVTGVQRVAPEIRRQMREAESRAR